MTPIEIIAWILSVRAFSRGGRFSPNSATSAPKMVRMSTHSSSEPSWLPQVPLSL